MTHYYQNRQPTINQLAEELAHLLHRLSKSTVKISIESPDHSYTYTIAANVSPVKKGNDDE